ncbi:hypothetical protein OSTOST_07597, partial [Ostertagia ostertagi]
MDSDSDEDRLFIVEEDGDRIQIKDEACEERYPKDRQPLAVKEQFHQEDDVKFLSSEKEKSSSGRRQQRSRLPASLKDRIVRSSARTSALASESEVLTIKPQRRVKTIHSSKQ